MNRIAASCLLVAIAFVLGKASAQDPNAGAPAPAEQQRSEWARGGGGGSRRSASRNSGSLARQVVEAYLDAIFKGELDKAAELAVANSAPASADILREFGGIYGPAKLAVGEVLFSDRDDAALAVSLPVKLAKPDPDGQDTGRLIFSLLRVDGKWRVKDIDFGSDDEASAAKEEFQLAHAEAAALSNGQIGVTFQIGRDEPHEKVETVLKLLEGLTLRAQLHSKGSVAEPGSAITAVIRATPDTRSDDVKAVVDRLATENIPIRLSLTSLRQIQPVDDGEAAEAPPVRATQVVRLSHTDAKQLTSLASLLGVLFQGSVVVPEAVSNSLLVSSDRVTVEDISRVARMLDSMRAPGVARKPTSVGAIHVIPLRHSSAAVLSSALAQLFQAQTAFGSQPPVITADEGTNTVLVRCDDQRLQPIQELIAELDQPHKQPVDGEQVEPAASGGSSYSGGSPQSLPGPAESAADYDRHTRRAHQLAQQLRQAQAGPGGEDPRAARQAELRQAVTAAFEARQREQRADLAQLRQRLEQIKQLIDSRERIKQQVIERRVDELLNPALAWDPPRGGRPANQSAPPPVTGPAPAATSSDATRAPQSQPSEAARARHDVLRQRAKLLEQAYLAGEVALTEVRQANRDALEAEAALDDSPEAQRRIRQQQVDNLRQLRAVAETQFKAGQATQADVLAIQAELLKAEEQLEKVGNDDKPDDDSISQLDGEILSISDKKLVEISIGANDGVRQGMTLIVDAPRAGRYLGQIEVIRVEADRSVARVEEEADQKWPIRRGDRVGQTAQAIGRLQSAADRQSDPHRREQQLRRAVEAWEQLYNRNRTQVAGVWARLYQARCLEKLGDNQQAAQIYQELRQLPDDSEVVRKLKKLLPPPPAR